MTDWPDHRLETALTALAEGLDGGRDLADDVRARFAPAADRRPPGSPVALAASTIVVAAVLALIPATRDVAAGWLGLGATSIETGDELPLTSTNPPPPVAPQASAGDLSDELRAAGVTAALPRAADTDAATSWDVASRAATIRWPEFTLTIRLVDDETPVNRKVVPDVDDVEHIRIADGIVGLWIPDDHVILRGDDGTPQMAGAVLLWAIDEWEYRVSGVDEVDIAVAIAASTART